MRSVRSMHETLSYRSTPTDQLLVRFLDQSLQSDSIAAQKIDLEVGVSNFNSKSVDLEVRNQGVLVFAGAFTKHLRKDSVERVISIPLTLGENILTLQVVDGNNSSSKSMTIYRRPTQPIKAVLVGVDQTDGDNRSQIKTTDDVAKLAQDLMRFTDLVPRNLVVLDGRNVGSGEVVVALFQATQRAPRDREDYTLVFSYSGPGLTKANDDPSMRRCLLLKDKDDAGQEQSCLPLVGIENALNRWPRTVAILDTSFDGLRGLNQTTGMYSRTAQSYFEAAGTTGIQVPSEDHVYLMASQQNSPALVEDRNHHGLFSESLHEAFIERIEAQRSNTSLWRASRAVDLQSVFSTAQRKVVEKSEAVQSPQFLGLASKQVQFREVAVSDLVSEALSITFNFRRTQSEMRPDVPNTLGDASDLLEKALAIDPSNVIAAQAQCSIDIIYRDYVRGEQCVKDGLSGSKDSYQRARWLELYVGVEIGQGHLTRALQFALEAHSLYSGSQRLNFTLGRLLLITGQNSEADQMFESLLNDETARSGATLDSISQSEWGHVVLWEYVARSRLGEKLKSRELLTAYFIQHTRGLDFIKRMTKGWFGGIISRPFAQDLSATERNYGDMRSHRIARFLLFPKLEAQEANNLCQSADPSSHTDPVDPDACKLFQEYYLAIQHSSRGDEVGASVHLSAAVNTKKTEYLEYWDAAALLQKQVSKLAGTKQ